MVPELNGAGSPGRLLYTYQNVKVWVLGPVLEDLVCDVVGRRLQLGIEGFVGLDVEYLVNGDASIFQKLAEEPYAALVVPVKFVVLDQVVGLFKLDRAVHSVVGGDVHEAGQHGFDHPARAGHDGPMFLKVLEERLVLGSRGLKRFERLHELGGC